MDPGVAVCAHCGQHADGGRKVAWWHLHRRMYDWTIAWAYRPSADVALFVLSFSASSWFPIPPDVLLMPLVLGNHKRWLRHAINCSVASALGAIGGFLIGMFLWGAVGGLFHEHMPGFERDVVVLNDGTRIEGFVDRDAMELDGFAAEATWPLSVNNGAYELDAQQVQDVQIGAFSTVGKLYERHNFWIVFTAGFTPIPFKVITITAGVFGTGEQVGSPWVFFTVFAIASIVSRSARFFLIAGMMRLFGPRITPFIDKYFNWVALAFTVLLIGGFALIKYAL